MAFAVTHAYVATGTDSGNGEVHKSEWNANHALTMATGYLLGRTTAGTGAVEEISVGSGLSLAAGVLSATAQDHGSLTGLADDDHSQYHNDTRGDTRYIMVESANAPANPVVGKPWFNTDTGIRYIWSAFSNAWVEM